MDGIGREIRQALNLDLIDVQIDMHASGIRLNHAASACNTTPSHRLSHQVETAWAGGRSVASRQPGRRRVSRHGAT